MMMKQHSFSSGISIRQKARKNTGRLDDVFGQYMCYNLRKRRKTQSLCLFAAEKQWAGGNAC